MSEKVIRFLGMIYKHLKKQRMSNWTTFFELGLSKVINS